MKSTKKIWIPKENTLSEESNVVKSKNAHKQRQQIKMYMEQYWFKLI